MTQEEQQQPVTLNDADSMLAARGYAGLIGEIPSSFTSTLRTLIQDEEKNQGALSHNARFLVLRLLKGPSLLAPFYFSALTFRGLKVTELESQTPQDLIKVFSPHELAGLVSLIFLYRKIRSVASEQIWADITSKSRGYTEVGGHLGMAIPRIGLSLGLFIGTLPSISIALFEKHDPKGFKEYLRHLKSKGVTYDLAAEKTQWGCTRFNISSIFIQLLGFGISVANAFSTGMSCTPAKGLELQGEEYRIFITQLWMETLLTTGTAPEMRHRGEYYPNQNALSILVQEVGIVRERGTRYGFLEKNKDDITPEKTPELYQKSVAPAAAAPAATDDLENIIE